MPEETRLISPQYWLAELDQYGNPKLVDGAHSQRSGVVAAMAIYRKCGFDKGRKYAVAKVELFPVYSKGEICQKKR
jgi:hypothetical protein